MSPLSERRGEKKLEGPRSYSNMTSGFSRLDYMFDECIDKKGQLISLSPSRRSFELSCMEKENAAPASGEEQIEGSKSIVISEREMTAEGFNNNDSDCSYSMTEKIAPTDLRTKSIEKESTESVSFPFQSLHSAYKNLKILIIPKAA